MRLKSLTAKFCLIFGTAILVFTNGIPDAFAQILSSTTQHLSQILEQHIQFAAPNNQGLSYFILPESSDFQFIPAPPQNPLTATKVHLGQLLFHETALTINPLDFKHWQQGSCGSCHLAQAGFRSNLAQALGVGGLGWNKLRHRDPSVPPTKIDKQGILAPSVLNSAYLGAAFWNGRAGVDGANAQVPLIQEFDINRFRLPGLEAQAIDGFTAHRMGTAAIAKIPEYQALFAQAFPDRPYLGVEVEDRVRSGLAIAAYERTLIANQAPFQRWLKGDRSAMSDAELRGGIVFFRSSCVQCHTGPSLSNQRFAALGFADHADNFTGLTLGRGAITQNPNDDFKFKVPQLYNLADSSPYGHGASFNTIRDVVEYLNQGQPQKQEALYSSNLSVWFKPLNLPQADVDDLIIFLEKSLHDPNLLRYFPTQLPSGACFPNNDPISRKQLQCD